MKTSAESLLITISNAQKVRQMRERKRIKGEQERKEERERERVGFHVHSHGSQKLNEHEICTVSAGHCEHRRAVC